MTTAASRLGFFKITVADAAASQRFYEEAFGMVANEPIVAPGFREHVLKTPDAACGLILFEKDGLEITRSTYSRMPPPFAFTPCSYPA